MNANTTPFTLWAAVEDPYSPAGGTQDHWQTFRAASDDDARRIAAELLEQWRRDFGGYARVQLRNDRADYALALLATPRAQVFTAKSLQKIAEMNRARRQPSSL